MNVIILDEHQIEDGRIIRHLMKMLKEGNTVIRLHYNLYNQTLEGGHFSQYGEIGYRTNRPAFKNYILNRVILNTATLHLLVYSWNMISALNLLPIQRSEPTIIHVHDPVLLPTAVLLKKRYFENSKIIYDRHEIYEKFEPNLFLGIPSYLRLNEILTKKWIDGVVTISSDYDPNVFPGAKFTIVPNYPVLDTIDSERVKEKISTFDPDKEFFLSYIGSLNFQNERDIGLMIRIATQVLTRYPKAQFFLGGHTWGFDEEIQGLIAPLQDEFPKRFWYLGPVANSETRRITEQSHFGFFLLKPKTDYWVLNSPNKVFEYLACGTIPIIRAQIIHEDEISQCALIFDRDSPEEDIISAVLSSLENPIRCKELMEKAMYIGKNYCFESVADRYVRLYNQVHDIV